MVLFTTKATQQLEALERHFASLDRNEAAARMATSVGMALDRIERGTGPFWPAPRPYPGLAELGWQWLKEGRYWIAFVQAGRDHAITGIFFETANIPDRL